MAKASNKRLLVSALLAPSPSARRQQGAETSSMTHVNILQRKQSRPGQARIASNGVGLTTIIAKYKLMNLPAPVIEATEGQFTVSLPLLIESTG